MASVTFYCHANNILLCSISFYKFEQWLAQLECINITSQYCFKPSKRLYKENHVSDIENCTQCHGLWFWMLTEYNGLDTSRSGSFDKPNLHVSITQESYKSLIPLAYALGVLCIMVGRACLLKGLLFFSRLTEKKHCLGDMTIGKWTRSTET